MYIVHAHAEDGVDVGTDSKRLPEIQTTRTLTHTDTYGLNNQIHQEHTCVCVVWCAVHQAVEFT